MTPGLNPMDMWAAGTEEEHPSEEAPEHRSSQRGCCIFYLEGELWVISPEHCVSRVGSWTSWHSETPPGVHEVTEICI